MGKEKRKITPRRFKLNVLDPLLPTVAFLIMIVPSIMATELIAYLFTDRLVYPIAIVSIMTGWHVVIAVGLLISWVTIRLIIIKKFIVALLVSIVLIVLGLAFISVNVSAFETIGSIVLNGKHYHLRQALIHDYSTEFWDKPNGDYTFVHKCDSLSFQCETVFFERLTPLTRVGSGYEFYIANNQLLLVYGIPHTGEPENVAAIIEDNLEEDG